AGRHCPPRTAGPATPARTPRTARTRPAADRPPRYRPATPPAARDPRRRRARRARPPRAGPPRPRCPAGTQSTPAAPPEPTPARGDGSRTPARWSARPQRLRSSGCRPGGTVEVFPAVALADHGFQVLLPDHAVGDRVLDDRADDAGGGVAGAQDAVAEMGGQGQPVGDHGDR